MAKENASLFTIFFLSLHTPLCIIYNFYFRLLSQGLVAHMIGEPKLCCLAQGRSSTANIFALFPYQPKRVVVLELIFYIHNLKNKIM